jgi:hypothetical protein
MGARLKLTGPGVRQQEKIRIDIRTDRGGEFFEIRCHDGVTPEILDVNPSQHHLVLMVRDGNAKNKFLLGRDERHWFAAAVPGDNVRDIRTAKASLRPVEIEGQHAIRQGEWFFVPSLGLQVEARDVHRNEPLNRGSGKSHWCQELARTGGTAVMVSTRNPSGASLETYQQLIRTDHHAQRVSWRRMVRDAVVHVRGSVRHPDHKTIWLDGWHRVYLNRERFARHAPQIAFLD